MTNEFVLLIFTIYIPGHYRKLGSRILSILLFIYHLYLSI